MGHVDPVAPQTEATPRLWTRAFIILTISNLFLFLSFQMLIPTLPVFVANMGGDELAVGMVISVFTISALLARPFAGKALDSMDRRKVLVIGLILFILCSSGYYWMSTIFLVLSLRFIHGIGWGISTTAYGTIVSDLIPQQRRGEGMGYYGLSSNFAMAFAPLIGIWIMNDMGFGPLFTVSVTLGVIGLILSQFIHYPEPQRAPQSSSDEPERKGNFYAGLVERSSLFPSLLMLMISVTYGGIVSFITLFGKEVGIGNVGWFFLGNAVVIMLTRPFAGKLFDMKGHAWVLLPGIICLASGVLLLSFADTTTSLLIAAIFYGFGFGAVQPSLQAWTIDRAAPHRRGAANSTFFSAFDLGIGIGAMGLGAIANASSYALMYRYSAIMTVSFLVVYGWYLVRNRMNV
ncbi:MFS transporter [Ammoniphilus oxalaticus]|uniref:MFS transporter n=1 Tax=Ammoniphilus oxalaticus TaxID=66863 RepID=A0A419SGE0_9BACL|nr:MFS transporter [Ammoniphilus oxalaticus]RKD22848.1 MFS transporter [Ammoniphilus oxalaticus]